MNPEIKAKWVKALRSGKYTQGREYLYMPGGRPEFCCLGVLAKIQGATFDDHGQPIMNGKPAGRLDNPLSYLSPKAAAGVHFKTQKKLGSMNDASGTFEGKEPKTFKQIADYIEKHL